MQFTIADIMREEPCSHNYPRQRVEELWNGRESISHREIAELNIPVTDRIWALSRLLYRVSPYRSQKITRMIALDVADQWPCPDICWWYLTSGDTAARDATGAAANDAAANDAASNDAASRITNWPARVASRAAARAASRAASRAAARDATWAATWAAARAATRAAVWAAAWDAALRRYLEWICRFGFEV